MKNIVSLFQNADTSGQEFSNEESAAVTRRRTRTEAKAARRKQEKARDALLDKRGGLFHELHDDIPLPKEPQDYDETLRYRSDVSAYFENDLDLFPDFGGGLLRPPRPFYAIYRDEIDTKFQADAVARDIAGLVRSIANRNFARLVIAKRVIQLMAILIAYFVTERATSWINLEPAITEVSVLFVVLALFALVNAGLYWNFQFKAARTCARAGTGLQSILKNIESAYGNAVERLSADENRGEALKDEWPARAAWWSQLILWYPKRVEHIEKAFQIGMWRIRNFYAIIYVVGFFLLLIPAALGVYLALTYDGPIRYEFLTFTAVVTLISYWGWRPKLTFIRDEISTGNWDRFSSFKSHSRLAEVMEQDKHKIIDEQRRNKSSGS
ncbi:MAG: hypothetical protein AAFX52_14050 [Pseudomonadota bacterium]